MTEKIQEKISLKEEGAKIVMTKESPKIEMNSKDVLIQIKSIRDAIEKNNGQIETMKKNIPLLENANEENNKRLKMFVKYEQKMINIQQSKAKAIYGDVKDECKKKIEAEYKNDTTLTEEQNKQQMFRQYQNSIATHKRVADELSPPIMSKMYFTESIIENPWG